jgi:hypothetical protein
VVVAGPPLAGKSRSALQAIREAERDAAIVAPRGPDELKALLAADPRLHVSRPHRILWLDDLPQYVQCLDQPALDRLPLYFPPPNGSQDARFAVVATVRQDEWTAMLAATGPAGQLARGLADRASVHCLPCTDPVFEAKASSIYPDEAFANGPGQALATSGMEMELPEPPRPPFEPAGPERWDTPAKVLAGLAALAAIGIVFVLVGSGFSTPTPPPMAAQIAEIERQAGKDGQYAQPLVSAAVDLHGTGEESRVFRVSDANVKLGEPAPSEEIRIYDDQDGWLRPAFRFRPAAEGVKLEFRGALDIDGDGAGEIVGAFAAPDARYAMLPFAVDWNSLEGRYAIVPLDLGPPALGDAALLKRFRVPARQYRERYAAAATIRDATSTQRLTGHRVQDFVIATPPRIVAAYFLRPPLDLTKDPALYEIHAAILKNGRSPALTPCALTGVPAPRMEILLSERSQRQALAKAWTEATADRYCAVVSES